MQTHRASSTPVERIQLIVAKAIQMVDANPPLLRLWAGALGTSETAIAVWAAIGTFDEVVSELESQLRTQTYFSPERALASLEELRQLYFTSNLEQGAANIRDRIRQVSVHLEFIADMVKKLPAREKPIGVDRLRDMAAEITKVVNDVVEDLTLPQNLKTLMIELALKMRMALEAYDRFGLVPVETALGAALVQVFYNPLLVNERNKPTAAQSASFSGFMKAVKDYGEVVGVATATEGLVKGAEELRKLLFQN